MPRSAIRCDARWDHLPFSPAVAAGPFVFVSGQASVDDAGAVVSGPFEDEFRRSWDNVRRVLAAAGMTLDHVVKVTSYLARQEDRPEYDRPTGGCSRNRSRRGRRSSAASGSTSSNTRSR